ncbi:MAG: hypothetical protein SNJ78_06985, partial [Spirochaetales bacterium]
SVNLGPGAFGVFLGAKPRFTENSVWYEELYTSVDEGDLTLELGKDWYQFTLDSLTQAKQISQGQYLVAFPDLVEGLDTLAALYGTSNILIALLEQPERIHALQRRATSLWFECMLPLYEVIKDDQGWSCFTIFDIWGPGPTIKLQCDLSAMLSPEMFDEFVVPYLKEQADRITSPIYHLDGVDAMVHLPSLLNIPSIKCIQWTPGAGKPDAGDPCWWDTIYKPVLDRGKCLHATMVAKNVLPFVKRFGGRGVFLKTLVDSLQEGEELFRAICETCKGGVSE